MSKFYSRKIQMPKTRREGLQNFVQMIINRLEDGETENALLVAVDLLEDLRCGIYDDAMEDPKGRDELAKELTAKHQADIMAASQSAYERGVADEKGRMAKALQLVA